MTDGGAWLTHVTCGSCGHEFADGDSAMLPPPHRPSCPGCGSTARRAHVLAKATVGLHASVSGIGFRHGEKTWFVKFLSGHMSWFRKTGRWHLIDRTINRRIDQYDEVIVDRESGEVVHECHEPLSEHRGHGDAKPRNERSQAEQKRKDS